jgi:hypothetical protein
MTGCQAFMFDSAISTWDTKPSMIFLLTEIALVEGNPSERLILMIRE